MRTNQKYFACAGKDGALAPAFVCVANIDSADGGTAIVEGNRRVLAARLADARFFWEQDLKVPLEEQAKKLDGIVFHEKLGTVADKRGVASCAMAGRGGIVSGRKREVERGPAAKAIRYAWSASSRTAGSIGAIRGAQGEPPPSRTRSATTIAAGQGDAVPSSAATVAIGLADKLDTICAFFGIDQKPTGSKDPFAVRRAAIGAIELVVRNGLRLPLVQAVRGALANSAAQRNDDDAVTGDRSAAKSRFSRR